MIYDGFMQVPVLNNRLFFKRTAAQRANWKEWKEGVGRSSGGSKLPISHVLRRLLFSSFFHLCTTPTTAAAVPSPPISFSFFTQTNNKFEVFYI
jgi:hypothetical protein